MVIHNIYYITEICNFEDCSIDSGKEFDLGKTSVEQDCARLVQRLKPDSLGATVYSGTRCFAEYGETKVHGTKNGDTLNRCCVFDGNISLDF